MKKREISSHLSSLKKKFVKSTLVISLVKTLLSRNFCKKCERKSMMQCAHCGKTTTSLSLKKKFRQITYLVICLVKPMLSRNFYKKSVRENFCNFHTSCCVEKREISSHLTEKKLRQVKYSNFFNKNITFTKFLQKCERMQMSTVHTILGHTESRAQCGKPKNLLS